MAGVVELIQPQQILATDNDQHLFMRKAKNFIWGEELALSLPLCFPILWDYLRNGNITHSVNLPEVHQPRAGGKRICIIHKNEPGMISQITALTTEAGLNIENMVNKSKKNMAYTMLDATGAVDARLSEKLSSIPAVIRVRIL